MKAKQSDNIENICFIRRIILGGLDIITHQEDFNIIK